MAKFQARLDKWMADHIDLAWKIIYFNYGVTVVALIVTYITILWILFRP